MLHSIISTSCVQLGLLPEIVEKLVTFIDRLKIQGFTGGEAASRFADYLGFLRIPDDQISHKFFADRWTDHRVWIDVPDDLRKYLNSDTPLFTPNRLEPQYQQTPFYDQGVTKVNPGTYGNPDNGGSVRRAPPVGEDYSNFIVNENLPDQFYLEVNNPNLEQILSSGLDETDYEDPYKIYSSVQDARDSLFKDLAAAGYQRKKAVATDYTLVSINTDFMEMNNNVFYTRKMHGHRQGTRSYGYFYTGDVKPKGLSVSPLNKTSL